MAEPTKAELQARIAELEQELASCRSVDQSYYADLDRADAEITRLRNENEMVTIERNWLRDLVDRMTTVPPEATDG